MRFSNQIWFWLMDRIGRVLRWCLWAGITVLMILIIVAVPAAVVFICGLPLIPFSLLAVSSATALADLHIHSLLAFLVGNLTMGICWLAFPLWRQITRYLRDKGEALYEKTYDLICWLCDQLSHFGEKASALLSRKFHLSGTS